MKNGYLTLFVMMIACSSGYHVPPVELCHKNFLPPKVEQVSFRNIIVGKDLNGKFIEIEGFFAYSFEDVAIYPETSGHDPGIWLNLKFGDSSLSKLTNKKVSVIGKVNLKDKGHDLGYLFALDSVYCIKEVQ
jgi:hypothetical protein